ncbi:MAG: hypothetical protein DMF58_08860 [Acidobacteria bacterium]|nr:MAG: hypothetical protein DMF58_08860 [Acidobacteriota bacterium]
MANICGEPASQSGLKKKSAANAVSVTPIGRMNRLPRRCIKIKISGGSRLITPFCRTNHDTTAAMQPQMMNSIRSSRSPRRKK